MNYPIAKYGIPLLVLTMKKPVRNLYYRTTLGATLGLALGLFPAAMLGKSLPSAVLLVPIGAFVGAALATPTSDSQSE